MKSVTILSIVLLAGAILSACESAVEGLNVSPNNPTSAPADLILTSTQVANILSHEGEAARRTGMWSGYFTGEASQYEGFQEYRVNAGDFNELWGDLYTGVLRNARVARADETRGKTDILVAITKVLEAHGATTAASLWGNVPYSEVAQPFNYTPVYEEQVDVYNSILNLLDEAIADFRNGNIRPRQGSDIHFNGDSEAWTEVAYTLKARVLMYLNDYPAAYEAATSGISTPDHSMLAQHFEPQSGRNLYEQFMTSNRREDFSARTAYLPRLLSPNSSIYRGNEKTNEAARFRWFYVTSGGALQPNTEDGYFTATAPFPLVSFEENLLILAEAGTRAQGFSTGLMHLNAYRQYLSTGEFMGQEIPFDGLRYDPYTSDDFATGGMENPGGLSTDNALLKEILEERYVSFYGQVEGFNDLRRTWTETSVRVDVPVVSGDAIPQRFLYPQTEVDRNSENVPTPIPDLFEPTFVNQ